MKRQYDIAFLLCANGLGGAEISLLRIAHGLQAGGLRVALLLYGRQTQLITSHAGNCTVIELGPKTTLASLPRLYRTLRRIRPAVLLSAFPHTNLMAILAGRLASPATAVIVTEHSSLRGKYASIKPLISLLYPLARYVVAVSEALARELQSLTRKHARIEVIYNPVIRESEISSVTPPHPWLAEPVPVIIAVGRLTQSKGFVDLLNAFHLLHQQRAARLIILGEGDMRSSLHAQSVALGISDLILMPGHVENVPDWLHHATIFVSASHHEGFGNAIVEALHSGLPVIATDCPVGPSEILDGGSYGVLVTPHDPAALAAAILQALDKPYDPTPAQTRAQDFTQSRCLARYLVLLQPLLA